MNQSNSRQNIPKAYDPKVVEKRIYDLWLERGYFTPVVDHSKQPFVVVMPPFNVTSELHLGGALVTALEDMMVRWHRMKGDPTLYIPGIDHAGIATQWVVERMLSEKGITRHQLGRDKFLEEVWAWVDHYGERIYEQIKRLGASCDWTRKRFTLDEGPSMAVRTTFVNLYKKGLIYRGERIISWCPRCATALSDLEVKHQEESASLYYIRYPLSDGTGFVTVATTRPETLLADTAVAVNPDDARYSNLIGNEVVVPISKRGIPIIADSAVDADFGTGVLKITPGHAIADFEIGQRQGLPIVNVINPDGTMNEKAGHYQGQDRFECRKNIVEELDQNKILEKIESYHPFVGHCDRCDTVVEPMVSRQWWLKMGSLAEPAKDAVTNGSISIIPDHFAKVYFNWLDNIQDWCISRQLWWGHRIPVWYCDDCGHVLVDYEDPSHCNECDSQKLSRDPDVLDTWFSSALWPYSTLGWPKCTEDLDYFYPTSVMETAYDILFFWVARMIMMGIETMKEIPFRTVYLHGLVLDPEGVKMSKTKGNVLDPLTLVDLYGADALRYALTTGTSAGNNMRLNEQKLESSRNFANKLWNAARFVITKIENPDGLDSWCQSPRPIHRHDRWILSQLNHVITDVQGFMEEYQFGEAQRVLHDFLWSEYCDWYLEMSKIRFRSSNDDEPSPLPILVYVLERILRLLHPFLPFITEEIWQTLMGRIGSSNEETKALMVASYPVSDSTLVDRVAVEEISAIREIVRAVRNLRAEFRIQPSQKLEAVISAPEIDAVVKAESEVINVMARVNLLPYITPSGSIDSGDQVALILSKGTMTVMLGGLVDLAQEKERLNGELGQIESNEGRISNRLKDENFISKAPEEVVRRERQRLEALEDRRSRIVDILDRMVK